MLRNGLGAYVKLLWARYENSNRDTDISLPLTEMLLSALISADYILVIVNHYFSVGRKIVTGFL